MTPLTVRFARAAQRLSVATRAAGLVVPAFSSPPRRPGAVRTLRCRPDGHMVVAVRLRDRPFEDILTDMVDGVCAANALRGEAATRVRGVLQRALGLADGALPPGPPPSDRPELEVASGLPARMAERQTQAA